MTDAVVFAIAGAKGGVGKTTTSINLSAVLAEQGRSVLLVELDVAMANVCDFLDLGVDIDAPSTMTLYDVLDGTSSLDDATYEVPDEFSVVPSGTTLEGLARLDVRGVADVVSEAREAYDVVILDTGAGIGRETVLAVALADETILVSSPRVAAVRDTKKTRQLVEHVDGTVAGVVFVKSGSGRSPGVERIAEFLDVDLLGHVPADPAVPRAQDIGRPVVSAADESDAANAYGAFGSRVYDRINAVQARRARREQQPGREEEQRRANGETLSTDDDTGDGFDFVSENGEQASGSNDTTDQPAVPARQNGRRTEKGTATAGARRSPAQRASVGVSRVAGARSAESSTEGATDEDIAIQLESVEPAEPDGTAEDASEEQSTDDEGPTDEGESGPESIEDKESAAKRFIDRAIGMIDRGD